MSSPSDRRAAPRFAVDLEAFIHTPSGDRVAARTIDLSFSGVCVHADGAVPAGSRAEFGLRLLLEWAETEALLLPGQVVWCTRTAGGYQVGARFVAEDFDAPTWERLDVLLKFLGGQLQVPQPG